MDKEGGPQKWISDVGRREGRRRWIKKLLNMNIMNFKKVDKPRGNFDSYLEVFSLYLAIIKKKIEKMIK